MIFPDTTASNPTRFQTMDMTSNRAAMVEHQIKERGIIDPHVIAAMGNVRREEFIDTQLRERAYDDNPLPIAGAQTISQPFIVAYMVEALDLHGGEKVLEIGTGSGYAAAVLAEIATTVFSVERIEELATQARQVLSTMNYTNVQVRCDDGTRGWSEHAPYDAILVSAASPQVPDSLKEQLVIGGRLVIPVGSAHTTQQLVRLIRISKTEFKRDTIADVRFVPLIGGKSRDGANHTRDDNR